MCELCAVADGMLRQGTARVRAIEALGTIEPSGPIERAAARVQMGVLHRFGIACARRRKNQILYTHILASL